MIERVVERWHAYLRGELPGGLDELLDDEVVFYSPIVYTPQRGKAITALYLQAAKQTLPGDQSPSGPEGGTSGGSGTSFRYTKSVLAGDTAVLEFETSVGGTYVNGVDIIRGNEEGRIVEFRVMIRPLQGCQPGTRADGGHARADEPSLTPMPIQTVSTARSAHPGLEGSPAIRRANTEPASICRARSRSAPGSS